MNSLWLAIGFLSVIPTPDVGEVSGEDFRKSRRWYPLVGLLLGTISVALALACRRLHLPPGIEAALVLGGMLLATGFLHLDGLLDCADALIAPVTPERRLVILKDVHMGAFAFGVGSLTILVFWQLLAQRPALWLLACLPVLSRTAVLLPMTLWPYARKDGSGILASVPWNDRSEGLLTILVATLLAAPAAWFFPAAALGTAAATLGFSAFAARRLNGGLTGDCYGAAIVLSECAGLLAEQVFHGI
ncbi:MAG: hypothetical protein RL318_2889 [Fibrobacterota bacterium]|jgi:adenosylcobinamide-GDP ribazoletransferase